MSGPEGLSDLLHAVLQREIDRLDIDRPENDRPENDWPEIDWPEIDRPERDDIETEEGATAEIAPGLGALFVSHFPAMERFSEGAALSLSELSPPVDWRDTDGAAPTAFMETLVVLNAAMVPGWPFASSLLRDAPMLPLPVKPVVSEPGGEMSEKERAQYLASLMAPYREALLRLRKLLRDIERLDPAEAEGAFRALMQMLGMVAQAVREALDLKDAGLRVAEELALANPSPQGPGSKRHRYRL
ncbi:hypothetical protein [Celeribacter sp.]|uniref:hypothetical protein n=1 Tax=Celeribacter sp. TaxID=1890673 RepID=UPI003A9007C6